jgi:olfactory receptor
MVGFLYGTIIWVYFQPPSQNSQDQDMVAAVMYTAITPLANPFVYSLRNKDVKGALHRLLKQGRKYGKILIMVGLGRSEMA